jgi:hypothetical protein
VQRVVGWGCVNLDKFREITTLVAIDNDQSAIASVLMKKQHRPWLHAFVTVSHKGAAIARFRHGDTRDSKTGPSQAGELWPASGVRDKSWVYPA